MSDVTSSNEAAIDYALLEKVNPEQASAIREGMNSCAFWKITLDESAPAVELPSSETKNFAINASIQLSALRGGNRLGNDPDAGVVLPPSTLRRLVPFALVRDFRKWLQCDWVFRE